MSSLKSSNKGLIILISSIACIVLSLGISLAVVLSTRANAFTTSNMSGNTVTVGELWNSSSNSFNTNNATTLIHMLSNSSSGTIDNIYNNIGSSAIKASTIRGYTTGKSSGQSIIVTLGGIQWTAMYLSKTKQDDVILTLWQSDATKTSTFGNSSSYRGVNSTTGIPTAMYGTSYIRAVTLNNGGNYVNITSDSSNPTSASLSATPQSDHEYALFTHSSSQLRQYIVQPQYVSWQESGQSAKTTLGLSFNASNENWSTSVSDDGFYGSGYNYAHKSGSDAWKTDYLWLPSMTETGYSGSAHGLWGTNQNERSNSLTYCWSRSSTYNLTRNARYLYADGSNYSSYSVNYSYAVRPALHLNLSSIIASIPASVGELWNSSSNSFNTNNATTLIHMLSNSSSGTIDNIYNNIGSSAINANTIRGYTTGKSSGQSIIVTLGGIQWTAMYLSKTKQDDVILTLWQSDATKKSTFGNSSSYYGANSTTGIPTAMYGTSYIRAVTLNNGGNYVNITSYSSNPTSASLSATPQSDHEYALFTHLSSQLRQYIVQPQYVSWQESGQSAKTTLGWDYNVSNENWSTSVSDDGFYNSGYNYAHKSGSDAWKTDYLWLPSMTETGYSGSAHGLWGTNQNERSNSLASCWSRSSNNYATHIVWYLYADGSDYGNYLVNNSYAVRPALHLNLTSIGYRISPVTVTLDNQGGSGDSAVEVMRESAMPTVTIPSRTGYTFNGYFSGTNGTGDKYYNSNGTSAKVYPLENSPTKLYAYWTPITYNIIYNGNGSTSGSMANSTHTYDVAKNLTTNAYSRVGYLFTGWSTTPSGAVAYQDGASVKNLSSTNGASITIYAYWTPIPCDANISIQPAGSGTVFMLLDGSVSTLSTVDYDAELTLVAAPTSNFAFVQWQINGMTLTNEQLIANPLTITVRADIEVVAIFADALISGVNVSATYGGTVRLVGDNFDSLADTDNVILVADVCVDGYRFSHWENLDGESLGTANSIRLTKAQVMDNVITAVFVLDDGTYKDNVNLDKDV